jgi:hypothetical protein
LKFSVGNVLIGAGGVVATAAVIAVSVGLKFSVPPELYTVVVYKGMFAAAAGLMIVGAMVGRHANEKRKSAERDRRLSEAGRPQSLSPPRALDSASHSERERNVGWIERQGP